MSVLILDCGNSIVKGRTKAGAEVAYPHALQELTEADYESILARAGRAGPGPDYLRVNGKPYAIGKSAERHGTLTRRTGAARYSPDYYGVFVAATLARLYERGGDVSLFGSHPPGDIGWRDDLMDAALGDWNVERNGHTLNFHIDYANTFDEPLGGLQHVLLTQDGTSFAHGDIAEGNALVLDIGGHTTDFLAVLPGGKPDYSLTVSVPIGVNGALADFRKSLHNTYRELFKSGDALPEQYRAGLASGVFKGAGGEWPCENEAREATSALLNRIARAYQDEAGGAVRWRSLVLTGGGSAMLFDRLLDVLGHKRVFLAEDIKAAHLANVRGGAKLWKLYSHLGVL